MKKILVTGANGQLGNSIRILSEQYAQFVFIFTDVDTLDICNLSAVRDFMKKNEVSYVLNCAAYTAVEKAEDNKELCELINRDAVRILGMMATEVGAKVIHISTDYVFNGMNYRPYVESDQTAPVSVYGETKLAGEGALQEVCPDSVIIRTAWLYSEFGNNFVKTMLRLGKERDELRVVFDQVGSPTYALDLAGAVMRVVEQAEENNFVSGIFHFSDEGVCSWYDFTVRILQLSGLQSTKIIPVESKDFPTRVKRPHYSVLNKAKIKNVYGLNIPHWEESLRNCLTKLKE